MSNLHLSPDKVIWGFELVELSSALIFPLVCTVVFLHWPHRYNRTFGEHVLRLELRLLRIAAMGEDDVLVGRLDVRAQKGT